MRKIIPLALLAAVLSACGSGDGGGNLAPEPTNVTGNWGGDLQTKEGGGLGAVDVTLAQAASSRDFTGTLTTPTLGGKSPLVGNADTGSLKSDTSGGKVNNKAALMCEGKFTKTSYRGDCTFVEGDGKVVLVLNRK